MADQKDQSCRCQVMQWRNLWRQVKLLWRSEVTRVEDVEVRLKLSRDAERTGCERLDATFNCCMEDT